MVNYRQMKRLDDDCQEKWGEGGGSLDCNGDWEEGYVQELMDATESEEAKLNFTEKHFIPRTSDMWDDDSIHVFDVPIQVFSELKPTFKAVGLVEFTKRFNEDMNQYMLTSHRVYNLLCVLQKCEEDSELFNTLDVNLYIKAVYNQVTENGKYDDEQFTMEVCQWLDNHGWSMLESGEPMSDWVDEELTAEHLFGAC